ncbi:hypothetical protein M405DRAFT_87235 [Rhizopogon salebrosus TDB-379]|nr:hypothetical protein M405DRAFT_87235 [Rhizopogon salebrosus TDB-379]
MGIAISTSHPPHPDQRKVLMESYSARSSSRLVTSLEWCVRGEGEPKGRRHQVVFSFVSFAFYLLSSCLVLLSCFRFFLLPSPELKHILIFHLSIPDFILITDLQRLSRNACISYTLSALFHSSIWCFLSNILVGGVGWWWWWWRVA